MNGILSGKTALVTGATGLLGGATAKALLQVGYRVRAMAREPRRAQSLVELGAEVVQGDMTNLPSLERAVAGCQVVINAAGTLAGDIQNKETFCQVNVEGAVNLAQAAMAAGVDRFVQISSAWVYGFDAGSGTNEGSPYLISHEPYNDTKLEADIRLKQLCQERGLPLVIVQPTEVYGPGDKHWTLTPLRFIRNGMMILIDGGKGVIQPIYVDDVAAGILAALRQGRLGESYLIAGTEPVTMRCYYGEYARMLGKKRLPSIPRWLAMVLAVASEGLAALTRTPPLFSRLMVRSNTLVATYDGSKAREELGFTPQVSLEEGMTRVSNWLVVEKLLG